jgi:glycerol-3-phosphate dehydrogenase
VGAGSTGAAAAHDLALRGLRVTVVERGEVASATTGRNHGLLHSGGRYCLTDPESAVECVTENAILRTIAPDLLELNGGLFVAVTDEDLAFKQRFLEACAACGIPATDVPVGRALAIEPFLNRDTRAAVHVPDGVFEPFHLCLAFLATARRNGAVVRTFTEVTDLVHRGRSVTGVKVRDHRTGVAETLGADVVVDAAGPWAGDIAAMAGIRVPVAPTAGVMVVLDGRLNNMVLNRLNKPSDGDIVVPQRATSIIGTTSWQVRDPDVVPIPQEHIAAMLAKGAMLVPHVRNVPVRATMAVARPLIARAVADGRDLTRTFECFDHSADNVEGFVTIAGGKTTTSRAMAERVADVVCAKLGVTTQCRTRAVPLAPYRHFYQ